MKLRIAIMGIRGIPANYGGFETFAEELATRLVERGHSVTVYGRSNNIDYKDSHYKGVAIKILPTISHKYLDTVFHTFLCSIHSLFKKFDVVLICNSANSSFSWIPRVSGKKVALNVDGLEWKRQKWNIFGKWFYKFSEYLATLFPNEIVTDALGIEEYYMEKFNKPSTYIPYGAPEKKVDSKTILDEYGLSTNQYILYVSRLEPENNAHLVLQAFENVKTDKKLVIVGDAPYSKAYIDKLKSTKDDRVIFTGYVFGSGYREFQSNAYIYVQATEVGGTHPALLEGMGYGNCVLANDVPEHREVLAKAGLYFSTEDKDNLTEKMQYLCDHPEVVDEYRAKAQTRVQEKYSWNKISQDYEELFYKILGNK